MASKSNFALKSSQHLIFPLISKRSSIWLRVFLRKVNILYIIDIEHVYCIVNFYVFAILNKLRGTADKNFWGEDKSFPHLVKISW